MNRVNSLFKSQRAQRGQMIVLVVIGLAVLVAMVGLANDIGYAWRARVKMQSAADAAAIAGSDALFMGGGVSPSTAAQSVATQNGFTNGSGTSINSNSVLGTGQQSLRRRDPTQAITMPSR
jgi:uncharacterized membrane protein